MSVNLVKGQKISLKKEDGTSLTNVMVGLGWDPVETKKGGFFKKGPSIDIDCDASVFMLKGGRLESNRDVVYYGNLNHFTNSVSHTGDNLTGDGDGDDEVINVDLSKIPAEYDRLVFVVNIYQAYARKQNFGMIKNAFIRIVDRNTNQEMMKYNLSEKYDGMTAMIFGEVYRHNGEWRFNAIGEGTKDGSIADLTKRYK